MNELALFAGAGGGILGGKLLGWNTICAVEIEEYPRKVLLQRQRDGILEPFPIWDDITTFDGRPWKGCVDIITGGFPCQDISAAGKGAGIDGERSGLWGEMARVINEVRPRFTFVENSPMLTIRGLGRVLGDLSEMGYNARWCVLGADDAGAPHRRKRIWILAYSDKGRLHTCRARSESQTGKGKSNNTTGQSKIMGEPFSPGLEGLSRNESDGNKPGRIGEKENRSTGKAGIRWWDADPADIPDTDQFNDDICRHGASKILRKRFEQTEIPECEIPDTCQIRCNTRRSEQSLQRIRETSKTREIRYKSGPIEPIMGRVAHGVANRVDRLKAIGNGQVPAVAAIAFTILSEGLI